jgi:hypothetical protein
MSDKKATASRPDGYVIVTGPSGVFEGDTRQCVHCGGHWLYQPGSGNVRGFCFNCNGHFCGPECEECIPEEKQLDIMEGTKKADSVTVPVIWTP